MTDSRTLELMGSIGDISLDLSGSGERVFPPDIEDAANTYFQKIYTGQLRINEVIALLNGFKSSTLQREKDIFSCMIHNLFDEYRFFPKYPDKELRVTGVLFGALIQHQLIAFFPLSIALRYVFDALQQDPASKMFKFGLIALEQFAPRLAEWPHYTQRICGLQHVKQVHASLHEAAVAALRAFHESPVDNSLARRTNAAIDAAAIAPDAAHAKAAMASLAAAVDAPAPSPAPAVDSQKAPLLPDHTAIKVPPEGRGAGHPPDIDALVRGGMELADQVEGPSDANADKILFLFNNISPTNAVQKAVQLSKILDPQHAPWLANYLVDRRLSVEFNFHDLYLEFVDALQVADFPAILLGTVYRAIRRLLQGEKIVTDLSERNLLKNLGSWLGLSTLARNRPLLMRHIKIKELLLHAFEHGRMVAVVPFVCKVLTACPRSIVFKPPNPWLMAQLRLLSEIYALPDLKLNLKFEIEVLCKALDVTLADIPPSTHLVRRQARITEHDFRVSAAATRNAAEASTASAASDDMRAATAAAALAAINGAPGAGDLSRFVIVNNSLTLLRQVPQLRACVPVAIERAVLEIIQPVVERSVTISCITTRELASKDFATEPSEHRLRHAAHLMVQNLAGSLAVVTCKEPLLVAIANHIRAMMSNAAPDQPAAVIDHIAQTVCADNIDWVCAVVEQAAMDKAVIATDDGMSNQFAARVLARERGQPFYDPSLFNGRFPAALPEPLRPVTGGLQPHHARVYEDFSRSARAAQMAIAAGAPRDVPAPAAPEAPVRKVAPVPGPTKDDVDLTTGKVMERYAVLAEHAEGVMERTTNSVTFASLPEDHELVALKENVLLLVEAARSESEAVSALAHRCFVRLFDATETGALGRDWNIAILVGLSARSPSLVARVTEWLIHTDGERRFRRDVVLPAVCAGLIDHAVFDRHTADVIADAMEGDEPQPPVVRRAAVDFAATLFALGLTEAGSVPLAEYASTLSKLAVLAQDAHSPAALGKLVVDVRRSGAMGVHAAVAATIGTLPVGGFASATLPEAETLIKDQAQLAPLFDDWLAAQNVDNMVAFVQRLAAERQLSGGELTARFFLAFTEIAVARASSAQGSAAHTPIDALARLVVLLVRLQPPAETAAVAGFLAGVLAVVVRVLYSKHDAAVAAVARDQALVDAANELSAVEQASPEDSAPAMAVANMVASKLNGGDGGTVTFSARPFHRLLVTLLRELTSGDSEPLALPTLAAFGNTLLALRPSRVPSFAFAWLELAAHRSFMPRLLMVPPRKGWMLFQRLITELLKFLKPHLARAKFSEPIRQLYNGTLRVLLVLLHDFPEFLSDYHFSLCDAIPPTCVQMRNLVLSAFPRNMRLPDPFTPNLKVDMLPEISQAPRMMSSHMPLLQRVDGGLLLNDLNTYLTTRQPPAFVSSLTTRIVSAATADANGEGPGSDAFGSAASALISSLTLHVGQQAIAQLQSASGSPLAHSAPMDVLARMMHDFDAECRYLLVNALANQLRYPNNHTHYFSCALLYLFGEAQQEVVQEQITRVLLERLIVNRPHPWGLLITFIELIKNPRYNFWSHSFTRCAPEIERLFESVARSCMPPAK